MPVRLSKWFRHFLCKIRTSHPSTREAVPSPGELALDVGTRSSGGEHVSSSDSTFSSRKEPGPHDPSVDRLPNQLTTSSSEASQDRSGDELSTNPLVVNVSQDQTAHVTSGAPISDTFPTPCQTSLDEPSSVLATNGSQDQAARAPSGTSFSDTVPTPSQTSLDEPSHILATNSSQGQAARAPSGAPLSDAVAAPSQPPLDQQSTKSLRLSNTSSAPQPAVSNHATIPPPRAPLESPKPATSPLSDTRTSFPHALVLGFNSPSSRPSPLAEGGSAELERERARVNILERRLAEANAKRPTLVKPFAAVPTNLQLQDRRRLGSDYSSGTLDKTCGDTNDRLSVRDFPTDRSLRSLSEAWNLGFEIGMESHKG